jgi:hypothetical protein
MNEKRAHVRKWLNADRRATISPREVNAELIAYIAQIRDKAFKCNPMIYNAMRKYVNTLSQAEVSQDERVKIRRCADKCARELKVYTH